MRTSVSEEPPAPIIYPHNKTGSSCKALVTLYTTVQHYIPKYNNFQCLRLPERSFHYYHTVLNIKCFKMRVN